MDFKVQKLLFKYLQVVIDKGNPKLLPFIITVCNSHCKQDVNDIDCKIAKGQNPQNFPLHYVFIKLAISVIQSSNK